MANPALQATAKSGPRLRTGGAITPLWTGPDPTGTGFTASRTPPSITARPDRHAPAGVITATMDRNTKFDSAVNRELQLQLRVEW